MFRKYYLYYNLRQTKQIKEWRAYSSDNDNKTTTAARFERIEYAISE